MIIISGIILFLIFLFLSGIHFYWGLGGKWAADAAIPTNENHVKLMNPGLMACFIVGSGLLSLAILSLIQARLLNIELPEIVIYIFRIFIIIFFLRAIGDFRYVGFFKKIKHTTFGQLDTKYYSPLCLLISILLLVQAIGE